jgi:hypothetical protein
MSLTNGSGSRRPKNIQLRRILIWIRIRIRNIALKFIIFCSPTDIKTSNSAEPSMSDIGSSFNNKIVSGSQNLGSSFKEKIVSGS